jgi:hypothetical protein
MGGPGSGSGLRSSARATIDDYRAIDVRRWAREGVLQPGYWGGWQWTCNGEVLASIQIRAEESRITLMYRHRRYGGEWKDEEYPVRTVRTGCNFGGSRLWFVCPVSGCGRRVAILYGGAIFACRHCYQLVYPSSRENLDGRMTRRADAIRTRLGWTPGILNGTGNKPKWMRWSTFNRLYSQHELFVTRSLHAIGMKFALIETGQVDR